MKTMARKPTAYTRYITGPVWAERRQRFLLRRPWCAAHGKPCRAHQAHHGSYWGWRNLGRELPWELYPLCRPAHDRISSFHQGRWCSNAYLLVVTWAVIGWSRLGRALGW